MSNTVEMYVGAIIVLILCHADMVQAAGYDEVCSSTSDCISDKGLTCVIPYTTCKRGTCRCPENETWDEEKCQPVLYIGSTCTVTRAVPAYSECVNGKVECYDGYSTMSYYHASSICLQGTKELGEVCIAFFDCVDPNALCFSSAITCKCSTRYKNVNGICRLANIGEICTSGSECNWSICGSRGRCECPSTFQNYEGGCVEAGTRTVGEACYSHNCELGLECSKCPGESTSRCLKKGAPVLASYNEVCSSTSDCESDKGLTCDIPFTTCNRGTCRCTETEIWEADKCQPRLSVGSTCPTTRAMPVNSECVDGKVKCNSGFTARSISVMSISSVACIPGTKGLGEECSTALDCYDPSAICTTAAGATKSACTCATNYKNNNGSCSKAILGETCTVALDCVDSFCGTGKKCECPSPLQIYEGGCVVAGTTKLNETCIAGSCELGLQCSKCPGVSTSTCLKPGVPVTPSPPKSGAAFIIPIITDIFLVGCLGGFGTKFVA